MPISYIPIKMAEVILSGKTSFKIEVPYTVIESGEPGPKPLILYLHGFRQNMELFQRLTKPMLNLRAYHVYIQGPYPVYEPPGNRNVSKWGRGWYLYDGKSGQFTKSLEITSAFIQEVVDRILGVLDVERFGVFGYSMGGYLGGYFALSRWKHVHEAIIIGGRIKTEVFENRLEQARHIQFLALHGDKDTSVYPGPQKEHIGVLNDHGFDATFKTLDAEHALTAPFIDESMAWLRSIGYHEVVE
ncbi:MAG: hypothetical protein AAFW89_10395 [Bacteroidota bacterium]